MRVLSFFILQEGPPAQPIQRNSQPCFFFFLAKFQNESHLVHKDVHRGVERDPSAGGHRQEAEPHAHVEPLTDAGPVQQLRLVCRSGRVSRRLFWRLLCCLGAATWR